MWVWRDVSEDVLIQFLTLRKLCSFVRSNSRRKPMASLKNAVVKLRNLKAGRKKRDRWNNKIWRNGKRAGSSAPWTSPVLRCPTAACESSVLYRRSHPHQMICKPEWNNDTVNELAVRSITDFYMRSTAVKHIDCVMVLRCTMNIYLHIHVLRSKQPTMFSHI